MVEIIGVGSSDMDNFVSVEAMGCIILEYIGSVTRETGLRAAESYYVVYGLEWRLKAQLLMVNLNRVRKWSIYGGKDPLICIILDCLEQIWN